MDGKFSEIELAFIDEQLAHHGVYLRDLLMTAIKKRYLIKSRQLVGGIAWSRKHKSNPELEFWFPDYGRFIEINYHKKVRSSNTKQWTENLENANRSILGIRENKKSKKRKKDTRWYAGTAYGAMNELIGRIMYGYSDIELERLKQMILNNKSL